MMQMRLSSRFMCLPIIPYPFSSCPSVLPIRPNPVVILPARAVLYCRVPPTIHSPSSLSVSIPYPIFHISISTLYHQHRQSLIRELHHLLPLAFLPPTAPPYAPGSTVLYPLSLLSVSALTLVLFFLLGGLCSSITTTSSLPPRLRLLSLSLLVSLLSSTITLSTLLGSLTMRTGLGARLTSTVSLARRVCVDPPWCDFRLSRATTMLSVYEDREDTDPNCIQVYMSQRMRRKPPTLPSTMPTTVPGAGPSLMLP